MRKGALDSGAVGKRWYSRPHYGRDSDMELAAIEMELEMELELETNFWPYRTGRDNTLRPEITMVCYKNVLTGVENTAR